MSLFSLLSSNQSPDNFDVWRDSPLRYAGYANEVGEAFRFRLPKLLIPSYGVAVLYVMGDTFDKTKKAMKTGMPTNDVLKISTDAFLWQFLASVAIPGFVINRSVFLSQKLINKYSNGLKVGGGLHPFIRLWVPTLFGLSLIPFIIHPIDHGVNTLFDRIIRPSFGIDQLIKKEQSISQIELGSTNIELNNKNLKEGQVGASSTSSSTSTSPKTFTKGQLDAMSLYIDIECNEVNKKFITCKSENMDPELCLSEGNNVFICVSKLFRKLNQPNRTQNQFNKYMDCLEENGGEFSKCKEQKNALDIALEEISQKEQN
mmetsp:Transcript_5865/g.7612  ORF Transcript_5865/g.7612 Transcript_5865/m.7612 type:complete len:316 (-) Transcript_5865:171-1118(-)